VFHLQDILPQRGHFLLRTLQRLLEQRFVVLFLESG
jgi:hypothetical protein